MDDVVDAENKIYPDLEAVKAKASIQNAVLIFNESRVVFNESAVPSKYALQYPSA